MKKIIISILLFLPFFINAQTIVCQKCLNTGVFANGNFNNAVDTDIFWSSVNKKLNCNIPQPQFGWGGIQQYSSYTYEKNEDFGNNNQTAFPAYYAAKVNFQNLCDNFYASGATLTHLKAQQFAQYFKTYLKERFSIGGLAYDIMCIKINFKNTLPGGNWNLDFQVKFGVPRYTNIMD
jgi:hypothetical protein